MKQVMKRKIKPTLRLYIKKQRHYFANKGPSTQSSNQVWTWELDFIVQLSTEELMLLNYAVGEDSW